MMSLRFSKKFQKSNFRKRIHFRKILILALTGVDLPYGTGLIITHFSTGSYGLVTLDVLGNLASAAALYMELYGEDMQEEGLLEALLAVLALCRAMPSISSYLKGALFKSAEVLVQSSKKSYYLAALTNSPTVVMIKKHYNWFATSKLGSATIVLCKKQYNWLATSKVGRVIKFMVTNRKLIAKIYLFTTFSDFVVVTVLAVGTQRILYIDIFYEATGLPGSIFGHPICWDMGYYIFTAFLE